jgi:hypothetical protein
MKLNITVILLAVLVVAIGYLGYVQSRTLSKKIQSLSSAVVDMQSHVKTLQLQSGNNVSFDINNIDSIIHKYESELENIERNKTGDVPQTGGDATGTNSNIESGNPEQYVTEEFMKEMSQMEMPPIPGQMFMAEIVVGQDTDNTQQENLKDSIEIMEVVDAEEEEVSGQESGQESGEESGEESGQESGEDGEDEDEDENEDDVEEEESVSQKISLDLSSFQETQNTKNIKLMVSDELTKKLRNHYLKKSKSELKHLCEQFKKSSAGTKDVLVSRVLEVDELKNINL